ncbi:hypothetical protein KJZ99_04180 [bacterium]|nr:hypothetical protein [bacterium]
MARPRRNGVDRFNIAIDIHDNPKFTLFKRTLGLSEGLAYLHLVRFIQYVAANHAFEPVIDPENAEIIADYCYYQGPGVAMILALQKAGFLTPECEVKDWFIHQPLAEFIHNRRVAGAKGGQKTAEAYEPMKDDSGKFNGSKQHKTPVVLPVMEESSGTQLQNGNCNGNSASESKTLTTGVVSVAPKRARAREAPTSPVQRTLSEIPKPNGRYPPDPKLEAMLDFTDRAEQLLGKLSENDRAGIRFDLSLHGSPAELDWILDQLQATKTDGRLNVADGQPGLANPVGWIRKQIQSETKARKEHT